MCPAVVCMEGGFSQIRSHMYTHRCVLQLKYNQAILLIEQSSIYKAIYTASQYKNYNILATFSQYKVLHKQDYMTVCLKLAIIVSVLLQ